jgi:hypothetical protein
VSISAVAAMVEENPRNRFVFLALLGFFLQILDNYFILVWPLVFP